MDRELARKVNAFFLAPDIDPSVLPGPAVSLSVLYLLRRDIQGCLSERRYLFPATMATLAGIDLLGKFYAGDDASGQVGPRFRNFIDAYFTPPDADDAAVIYALRNAMLHSFGLYSNGRNFQIYEWLPNSAMVERKPPDILRISVHTLYTHLEQAIMRYHQELITSEDLQQKFAQMVDHYGFIAMAIYNIEYP